MAKSLSGRVFVIRCLLVHAQSSMSVLLKDGFKNGILAWLWAAVIIWGGIAKRIFRMV